MLRDAILNPSPVGRGAGVRVGACIDLAASPDPHPLHLCELHAMLILPTQSLLTQVGHLLPMGGEKNLLPCGVATNQCDRPGAQR